MDINRYKFYVRDVGISDTDLNNVLQDVISDIAVNTKIFKRTFGFTLEPEIVNYPIKNIYQLADKFELKINYISDYVNATNENALIDFLKIANLKVESYVCTEPNGVYSDYIELIDVFDKSSMSYMGILEPLNKDDYYLTTPVDKKIEVIGIAVVNPLIDEITEDIEKQIRFAIISGLRAYTHTLENQQNIQPDISFIKQFEYDKQKLINQYPLFGLIKNRGITGRYVPFGKETKGNYTIDMNCIQVI